MIAIINIGPAPGNRKSGSAKDQARDPLGQHLYQVKINSTPKAVFTHTRADSLPTLLRLAAEAVEKAQVHDLERLVQMAAETKNQAQGTTNPLNHE